MKTSKYIDTVYGFWTVIDEFERYRHPFLKLQCKCSLLYILPLKMFERRQIKDKCYYCMKEYE